MENFDWSILSNLLFYLAVGYFVGKVIAGYLEAKNKKLEKDIQVLKDRIESRIISVTIEQHGDMFYLFDKKNDSFVAQGRTLEEVNKHVDQRFKGTKIIFANNEELSQVVSK